MKLISDKKVYPTEEKENKSQISNQATNPSQLSPMKADMLDLVNTSENFFMNNNSNVAH